MFTWIIEKKAKILAIDKWNYTLENSFPWEVSLWQSIAHDGACMTISSYDDKTYSFFMMQESLDKTNFWWKRVWDYVNIERCLKLSDRIDGHFVSGHIDTTWEVTHLEKLSDDSLIIWVSFDAAFSKNVIPKWSIALNGVSLTIVEKKNGYISVSLIPLTQDWTNLWNLSLWDRINIEFDMLGKYILENNNNA